MFEFQSVRRSFPRNLAENSEAASFLDQTTSFETEVQEREPWDFYEIFGAHLGFSLQVIHLQWKTQMRSEYFSHNVLAGNINRWKNITADGLFRKNGTTTIWIWKHWNNLMVDNCSKRNSNWEIDDWMVLTEVKISMKKKYSACLYFKLLKSYPNKYICIVQLKEKKKNK